jgi:hypothetical protein
VVFTFDTPITAFTTVTLFHSGDPEVGFDGLRYGIAAAGRLLPDRQPRGASTPPSSLRKKQEGAPVWQAGP